MAAITFTTFDREATVNGHERAYGAALAAKITAAVLDLDGRDSAERNRRILPASFFDQAALARGQAARDGRGFSLADAFTYWAPVAGMFGEDAGLRIGDRTAGVVELIANTAIVAGSDQVALLARIHTSAEDGLFVDAPHTNWLAGVIESGVKTRVLRDDRGWVAAGELLRGAIGPVLITTQVGVVWLLARAAGIYSPDQTGEQRWVAEEEFEPLPFVEQWDRTIAAYSDARGPDGDWWLTLAPESFHTPSYQDGLTAFDAIAETGNDSAAGRRHNERVGLCDFSGG